MHEDSNGNSVKPRIQDHFKGAPPMHPFEAFCRSLKEPEKGMIVDHCRNGIGSLAMAAFCHPG
jgi:hypothetical protein